MKNKTILFALVAVALLLSTTNTFAAACRCAAYYTGWCTNSVQRVGYTDCNWCYNWCQSGRAGLVHCWWGKVYYGNQCYLKNPSTGQWYGPYRV